MSCGTGRAIRKRICIDGEPGMGGCAGPAESETICNNIDCPTWMRWEEFSSCTVSCGGGVRTRTRYCVNGNVYNY